MNYNANSETIKEPIAPITQSLVKEIQEMNTWQADVISKIESALHSILNTRTPDNKDSSSVPPLQQVSSDFNASMQEEFRKMRLNSNHLEAVLNHLFKIV